MRTAHRVRLAAILAVGAFALHQLRFLIAFGDSPSAELAQQGHRYMSELLAPIAVLVLAGALATLLRGTEGASPTRTPLVGVLLSSPAPLSIYVGQETLEEQSPPGIPAALPPLRPRWLDRAPPRGGDRRPVGAARTPPRKSRARDRGGPHDAASPLPCAREPGTGPSGSGTEPAFNAPRLRPRRRPPPPVPA